MRHGSLFSGIGGFDLAAQWIGWENVFQVEIDRYCQRVLEKNFPNVKRYGDVKKFDGTQYRGAIDVLSGGFPCQPFSVAGKRKGKRDDRFLWPEMLRVIKQVRPPFIVGENVTGIISLALEQVLTEVEAEGYYTETFIIPACAVNAPHRRDRVWILAYTKSNGDKRVSRTVAKAPRRPQKQNDGLQPDSKGENGDASHAYRNRLQRRRETGDKPVAATGFEERTNATGTLLDQWENFPVESPLRDGNDGVSIDLVRSAIRAGGNAIVPQVAYEIFKAIDLIRKHGIV